MRFKRFTIRNYRAVTGPLHVDVDRKSLIPIIGINESGKTTILHAIFAFDHFNDKLNEDGRHLRDTTNLYRTSHLPATIEAIIELTRDDLLEAIDECAKNNETLRPILSQLRKKRGLPTTLSIMRDLQSLKYAIETSSLNNEEYGNALSLEIIRRLPYILFFDDFRDKVEEKIEIISQKEANATGWLAILEQLFKQTDKSLSPFNLPKLEERQRKSVLAKVQRHLNKTLTREWQNFRLDDRDALEISIDFISEKDSNGLMRHFIKLDIVETDIQGDQHYFYISDRSKGFYWFFNFVMKLEFNPKVLSDDDRTIYLLDEPGSYLHASAQSKLCAKLKQLSERNSVIYCTHSHYLLDPEKIPLATIAVAEKDGNGNVRLVSIYDYKGTAIERRSAFQPVMDALKIKPFLLDLTNSRVIVTEGIYDYFAIEMMKLSRPVSVLPSVGADSIKFYISLLIAWQVNFRAVWDHDDEGKKKNEEAEKLFGEDIAKRHLRLLPSEGGRRRILQDLFSGEDVTMLRSELDLPKNCSFEKTIATLFYSHRRGELIQKIASTTRANFEKFFECMDFQ